MQFMRYINLFEKISKVSTTHCFVYNNMVVFAVPKNLISKAVGRQGRNMRELSEILRKKVKVVGLVRKSKDEVERFVLSIVEPMGFNKLEIKGNDIIINAGRQSKAALIGRNRAREQELECILKQFFDIDKLKII